ncbi:unnamed protein product [Trichobilharzia regenti]|nr:unnamed protein product [Trichobilharzia regenti]
MPISSGAPDQQNGQSSGPGSYFCRGGNVAFRLFGSNPTLSSSGSNTTESPGKGVASKSRTSKFQCYFMLLSEFHLTTSRCQSFRNYLFLCSKYVSVISVLSTFDFIVTKLSKLTAFIS